MPTNEAARAEREERVLKKHGGFDARATGSYGEMVASRPRQHAGMSSAPNDGDAADDDNAAEPDGAASAGRKHEDGAGSAV